MKTILKLTISKRFGTTLVDNRGNIIIKNLNVEQIKDFKIYGVKE